MVAFYKHDIPAWMDGTENLSSDAYRAYHVVIQLIMLAEGPITLNERGIAGRCNLPQKAFRKALDELLAERKLTVREGKIYNLRAEVELENVRKNRENAGKGGKTRAERQEIQKNIADRHANPLSDKGSVQAPLENLSSLKEKRREEKNTDTNVSVGAKGKPSRQSALCPEGLEPAASHFAKAAERGYDRQFVYRVRDRMFRWSHSNAKRAVAKKSDWMMALHDFLERRMDEEDARRPVTQRPRATQADFLDAAREANDDLMKESDDGAGPFDGSRKSLFGAGRSRNGHAYPDLLEQTGSDLRLPPPRLAGPPRPH